VGCTSPALTGEKNTSSHFTDGWKNKGLAFTLLKDEQKKAKG